MDTKTLCLAVLSQGDCSGYEIRKQFESGPLANFQDAGFGSIYPALKRLTTEGLAVCVDAGRSARPEKKIYRITATGRQALFDAVNAPPGPDKMRSDFLFVLFFAELLPPRALDELIAGRIAYHRERIERMEQCDTSSMLPGHAFVFNYGLAYHRAELAFLEGHSHELIGALLNRQVAE